MAVEPKTVQGRRELEFSSLDDMIAEAEKLVSSPHTRTLGNWPLSQLLAHLATMMDGSIDGFSFKAPWYIRGILFFIKGRIVGSRFSPGITLAKDDEAVLYPPVSSPQEALEMLRRAVQRTKTERMSAPHPAFGALTHEQWVQLHLHHAELHLSFAVPNNVPLKPAGSTSS
jgi:hypothetical protein